jgi:hypothetical protein
MPRSQTPGGHPFAADKLNLLSRDCKLNLLDPLNSLELQLENSFWGNFLDRTGQFILKIFEKLAVSVDI